MPRWLIGVLIAAAILVASVPFLAIVAAILIPNFLHARAESAFAVDQKNLKAIAGALEEYAVDHGGKYPENLPQLVPAYLPKLPVVPGGDETGAYDYHRPASTQPGGKYEIWDDGSMDPTVISKLTQGPNGPPCRSDCKYVVYLSGAGIIGVSGQR